MFSDQQQTRELGEEQTRCAHGSVRAVSAGVHPGLVRADGGRPVQRGCGESDPQKQPELPGAAAAFLPPDVRG